MVTRIGGARRKSRDKMKKSRSQKGKMSLSKFFQKFNVGDQVVLKAEPAYQKGIYPLRFHGRTGFVDAKRGNCYEILMKQGSVIKRLIVHPIHLQKV